MAAGQYYIDKNEDLWYDDGSGFKKKGNVSGLPGRSNPGAPVDSSLPAYLAGVRVDPITKKPVSAAGNKASSTVEEATSESSLTMPAASNNATWRYPAKPGIAENTDYVLFDFYEYVPPFKQRNTSGTPLEVYNRSANSASSYEKTSLPQLLLYMPEDISTGYKANWTGKAFSNIGRDILSAAGQQGLDKLKGVVDETANTIDRILPAAGTQAVNKIISSITGDSLSNDDIFGSISGVILNPNAELLFGGIDFRTFSLTFRLVPRNRTDSTNIKEIIKTFKKAVLPKSSVEQVYGFSNDGISGGFIKVPDLCRVSFMRGGKLNTDVPQYKMCAITNVDINYTPDGTYATYTDGSMVAINLSVSFQETKLVFSDEVENY